MQNDSYYKAFEELSGKIGKQWQKFLEDDLPAIRDAVKGEKWIWE